MVDGVEPDRLPSFLCLRSGAMQSVLPIRPDLFDAGHRAHSFPSRRRLRSLGGQVQVSHVLENGFQLRYGRRAESSKCVHEGPPSFKMAARHRLGGHFLFVGSLRICMDVEWSSVHRTPGARQRHTGWRGRPAPAATDDAQVGRVPDVVERGGTAPCRRIKRGYRRISGSRRSPSRTDILSSAGSKFARRSLRSGQP